MYFNTWFLSWDCDRYSYKAICKAGLYLQFCMKNRKGFSAKTYSQTGQHGDFLKD